MLIELAKKDKLWRNKAYQICKDKYLADELVQEMYLKLHDYNKKINDNFVFVVLNNLFKNYKTNHHINIEELQILTEQKKELNYLETKIIEASRKLKFYELELLDMSGEYSYAQLEKRYKINKETIRSIVKKSKQKIWQEIKK